ncbi:MAG: hypothetical protein M3Q80_02120 [bacterium]|nr:hypothetical protein [bacterium]
MDYFSSINTAAVPPLALILFPIAVTLIGALVLYVLLLSLYRYLRKPKIIRDKGHTLARHHANPILSPLPYREWEAYGTLNPAAIQDDDGRIHLLYRAIGDDGLSHIGHSSSADGKHFDRRSPFPIYQPSIEEKKVIGTPSSPTEYNPTLYYSGGGWGGHEDPRAVTIENRVYMTYTAFQGWESVRIAVSSISMKDLKKERWNWSKPILLSPLNEVHKNWVLFPEKINGKFAFIHAVSPEVLIDYVDNLENPYELKKIRSKAPKGGRPEHWDNWVRGAGPPPVKTDIGWLLLYHAMDKKDPNKYKLGAMILDLNDPTKILYRSSKPILSPDACYENDGKPGVVYASGALIRNEDLYIYYGGGDKHVCMAQTPLRPLLDWLVTTGKVH